MNIIEKFLDFEEFPSKNWHRKAFISSFVILVFILLMEIFKIRSFQNFEKSITGWFSGKYGHPIMTLGEGFLNDMMTIAAKFFDTKPMAIFAVILAIGLIYFKKYLQAFWMVYIVASGGVIGIILKKIVQRPRPLHHLVADDGFSFPSGHSLASTLLIWSVIIVILPLIKRGLVKELIRYLLILIWGCILFSRLYFGAHYIGDVIGGVSLAFTWIFLNLLVWVQIFRKIS